MSLTYETLQHYFTTDTLNLAAVYVAEGRVMQVMLNRDALVGTVRGNQGNSYNQRIVLEQIKRGWSIKGACTCPVKQNCKHVAAVLIDFYKLRKTAKPPVQEMSHELVEWIKELEAVADSTVNEFPDQITHRLIYIIESVENHHKTHITVRLVSCRVGPDGKFGAQSKFRVSGSYSPKWPNYVRPIDKNICLGLHKTAINVGYAGDQYRLSGAEASIYLAKMISTGRCYWSDPESEPLRLGQPREAKPTWTTNPDGSQSPGLAGVGLVVIPTEPLYYVDPELNLCGVIETAESAEFIQTFLAGPTISAAESAAVRRRIEALGSEVSAALPKSLSDLRVICDAPQIKLTITKQDATRDSGVSKKPQTESRLSLHIANLTFDYGPVAYPFRYRYAEVDLSKPIWTGEELIQIERDTDIEREAGQFLVERGWVPMENIPSSLNFNLPLGSFAFSSEVDGPKRESHPALYRFLGETVPYLRSKGWKIESDAPIEIVAHDKYSWDFNLKKEGISWFSISLGVDVDGVRLDMKPILVEAVRQFLELGGLEKSADADIRVFPQLPDGRLLEIRADRLRPALEVLTELFGGVEKWEEKKKVPTAMLAAIETGGFKLPRDIEELKRSLRGFDSLEPVQLPDTFNGTLRKYQEQGVAWLQFLRRFGFGGILADDMGLGKTVQTLAHVSIEKASGRMKSPVLIVAPTSTLPNWRHEISRFAPNLSAKVHHGLVRNRESDSFAEIDVIVTSYSLLARDVELFKDLDLHMVVFDEAQYLKNSNTSVAQAAGKLNAHHRLCLTGTPIENNLIELWSQFNILMPGFLGGISEFKQKFAKPIEAENDQATRERLISRVKPFILRRTKSVVAKELPEKTEMIERIELEGAQRDLYESIRLAMDDRIRKLFSGKGLAKSRIEVLDALLKLRQVCCDPKLTKSESESGSVKLDRLLEMLHELRQEDRRILIFSQFTSMLDLIEERLREANLEWVRISGDTVDRETPVTRFQSGEVPLFLISLRAGGTGLNLTTADTVIHYDPWWNPAVENQATDRAHRIGQNKKVFVFKLVAADTVEERIIDLQVRKSQLAGSILDPNADPVDTLSTDDVLSLLAK